MSVNSFITLASGKNTLTSVKGLFTRPIQGTFFALSLCVCFWYIYFSFCKKALANDVITINIIIIGIISRDIKQSLGKGSARKEWREERHIDLYRGGTGTEIERQRYR